MDPERWQRLSPLLDSLFELPPDGARAAPAARLREEDPALTSELEALIALEDERTDFLAEPLVSSRAGRAARHARSDRTGSTACSAKAAWARSGWRRARTACTSAASR